MRLDIKLLASTCLLISVGYDFRYLFCHYCFSRAEITSASGHQIAGLDLSVDFGWF
jgi:hypothetical protein